MCVLRDETSTKERTVKKKARNNPMQRTQQKPHKQKKQHTKNTERTRNQNEAREKQNSENITSSIYSWRNYFKLSLSPPGIIVKVRKENAQYVSEEHIRSAISELRRLAGHFEKARIAFRGKTRDVPAEKLEEELKRIIRELKERGV